MPTYRTTVRTLYAATGGPGYSTFYFRDEPEIAPGAGLQAATNALRDAFTALRTQLPTTTVMDTDGRFVEEGGDLLFNVTGWTVSGTLTGQAPLPPASQLCVTWRTASNTRSGRGRTFLAGWGTGATVDGTPTGDVVNAGLAFAAEIIDFNASADNGAFGVWSRSQGVLRDITGRSITDQWAVLRSRRD